MRITILNGEPNVGSKFDAYIFNAAKLIKAGGHAITKLDLAKLDLKGCSGCFGCWVKTPGKCVKHDDSDAVCRAAIGADLLLLASPMKMGFTSALLKRAIDQIIPLLHPYFVIEGGEVHHRARYARYPQIGLLLGVSEDCDDEDIEITTALWQRTARNLKSQLVLTAVANHPVEEVVHELTCVA